MPSAMELTSKVFPFDNVIWNDLPQISNNWMEALMTPSPGFIFTMVLAGFGTAAIE